MKGLGALESRVMTVLWDSADALSVHDVVERLSDDQRVPAYTTVLTVLTHLWEKKWVLREKVGRSYRYRPSRTRAEATTDLLREILDASPDAPAVLLHLARTASAHEIEALRQGISDERHRR
ncbi:BlaI/MecI/CopY family transcriptional regulator [Nocardia tengchongensis]|uniref:BlaI/MecI/CopY family transcriptional regulator n=1 Tax=Nocardia tengchongensis TaxID=2055889 RepID=A0ABX8CJP3_9NOCA|nr:BlaI/MecI/CopY family transcriptional regulator [Nocardia tengchongensis]QVI18765.1 BlaI/MecI/CopY family transcriptional regulator [Nocardia tengchongensis]